MLASNKASQITGKGLDIQFYQVRYALSRAISTLLTKKTDAGSFILRLSNL